MMARAPGVSTNSSASAPRDSAAPPPRGGLDQRPVFIAGADRSGTTLLFALLASHPNISMVRRTNMWRYFHRRYGDLSDPRALDRCLDAMVRYRRLHHLQPDRERIRREFLQGELSYGRLFALFHQHHAERAGKTRWGDKSLHTEHHAGRVFEEFPDARILHMVRDPRDRYASVRKRDGRDRARVGAATARWMESASIGLRNQDRFPDRYRSVRFEDLVRDPEGTMRSVCVFIDEEYAPAMFSMDATPEHRGAGNSSFGDLEHGSISPRAVGRFASVLDPRETAFIDLIARGRMIALGYDRSGVHLSPRDRVRFVLGTLPFQLARMIGWLTLARVRRWRGARIPPARLADGPTDAPDE